MSLELNTLQQPPRKLHKRVGRGDGSGKGSYSGRGIKGQKSRSGGGHKGGYGGKRVPTFIFQIPKRKGFKSLSGKWEVVNISDINARFLEGDKVNITSLKKKGLIKKGAAVKILGDGRLEKKLSIEVHAFSASAAEAIKKAGGEAKILAPRQEEKKPEPLKKK